MRSICSRPSHFRKNERSDSCRIIYGYQAVARGMLLPNIHRLVLSHPASLVLLNC